MQKEKRIAAYQDFYKANYEFEKFMVQARHRYIAEWIETIKPEVVIEISCGIDQLFEKVAHLSSIREWVIIEPADIFAALAQRLEQQDRRVKVVKGFIEEVVPSTILPGADICVCSSVLHEVKSPKVVLKAVKGLLKATGLLHINVPNASSLHRQLAYEMGLVNSVYDLSERNKDLHQFRLFDRESLQKLVESVGFEVVEEGGYFMKPFTHQQMIGALEVVGEQTLEGFWQLGRKYPELASEIYLNAGKKIS